jgi:hypothetical protein
MKEKMPMKSSILGGAGLALVVLGLLTPALSGCGGRTTPDGAQAGELKSPSAAAADAADTSGKGMAAIRQAAANGKYVFMFFSKTENEQTLAMRKVFDAAMEKVADRAEWIAVDVNDSSEKAIVAKFDLSRAPMPLVLAMAPNGAITGGFPTKFTEQQLVEAFATPVTEKVMKHLQDNRLVLLCVQNGKTKSNDAAMQGVRDFKADARFAAATEIVILDPADSAEAAFLADLEIKPTIEEAMTVFLAPPGSAIAEFKGATNKDELAAALQKAGSGCAGGSCGPGGCPPR